MNPDWKHWTMDWEYRRDSDDLDPMSDPDAELDQESIDLREWGFITGYLGA